MSEHAWTLYQDGGAHCPKCGSVRDPDGNVVVGPRLAPCEPPPRNKRRVIDGVIITEGPFS